MPFTLATQAVVTKHIEDKKNMLEAFRAKLDETVPPDVAQRLFMAEQSLSAAEGKVAQQRDLGDILYYLGRADNTLGYIQCWFALSPEMKRPIVVPIPKPEPTPDPKPEPTPDPKPEPEPKSTAKSKSKAAKEEESAD